jgi:hypothetical protein
MEKQDWQKGEETTLTPIQRLSLHNDWLQKIHQELRDKFEEDKPKEDESSIIGFID